MSDRFYNILGISNTATPFEITKAYRQKAMKYHPDKEGGNEEKFKELLKAYEFLSKPELRNTYDDPDSDTEESDFEIDARLNGGISLADTYRKKMKEWYNMYDNKSFCSVNLHTYVDHIIQNIRTSDLPKVVKDISATKPIDPIIVLKNSLKPDIWQRPKIVNGTNAFVKFLSNVPKPQSRIEINISTVKKLKDSYPKINQPKPSNMRKTIESIKIEQFVIPNSNTTFVRTILNATKPVPDIPPDRWNHQRIDHDSQNRISNRNIGLGDLPELSNISTEHIFPQWLPTNIRVTIPEHSVCQRCEQEFWWLFVPRHHCRSCWRSVCNQCHQWAYLPQHGFVTQRVRVCLDCINEQQKNYIDSWLRTESDQNILIAHELSVTYRKKPYAISAIKLIGHESFNSNNYDRALVCFSLSLNVNEWIGIIQNLCQIKQYKQALRFAHMAINYHGQNDFLNGCINFNDMTVAVIYRICSKLFNNIDWAKRALEYYDRTDIFDYLWSRVNPKSVDFGKLGKTHVKNRIDIGLYCYSLCGNSAELYIEEIISSIKLNQIERAIQIMNFSQIDCSTCTNPMVIYVYYLIKDVDIVKWIQLITKQYDLGDSTYHIGLNIIRDLTTKSVLFEPKSVSEIWITFMIWKNNSILLKLDDTDVLSYVHKFSPQQENLIQIIELAWEQKRHLLVLDLLIWSKNYSAIETKAKLCSDKQIQLQYCLTVYQFTKKIDYYQIISLLTDINLIKSLLSSCCITDHAKYYPLLKMIPSNYIWKYNIVKSNPSHPMFKEVVSQMTQSYYQTVKTNIYNSDVLALIKLLSKVQEITIKSLEQLFIELVGNRNLEEFPEEYRSHLYLLRGTIDAYYQKFLLAIQSYQLAILLNLQIGDHISLLLSLELRYAVCKGVLQKLKQKVFSDLPDDNIYLNKLKTTQYIKSIRKYETYIGRNVSDPLEKALSYTNMLSIAGDPAVMIGCILMTCHNLLNKMKTCSDPGLMFAYNKFLLEMIMNLYYVGMKMVSQPIQLMSYRHIILILLEANKITGYQCIGNMGSELIADLIPRILQISQTMPFIDLPISRAADMLYVDLVFNNAYEKILTSYVGKDDQLVSPMLTNYYLFEGEWTGWFRNNLFQQRRESSIKSILANRSSSVKEIEALLQWPYLDFNKDGYRTTNKKLRVPNGYAKLVGISFDFKNKNITYLLQPANATESNLFDLSDISTVVGCGIVSSAFTLEQPIEQTDYILQSNPFQEMSYTPECLDRTNYLATLLHTDYLLKMFTMGVEVSNTYPFAIKSSDDLLSRAPPKVQKILRILQNKTETHSAHRFWIEAGDAEYTVERNTNADRLTYTFHDIKMKCRMHLLRTDKNGKLVDAEENSSDDSLEAKFARKFTKHYDLIASFYPEFARLKELTKMGLLTIILKNQIDGFTSILVDTVIDTKPITEHLETIHKHSSYPACTESNVKSSLKDVLRQNNVSEYQVSSSELNRVTSNIRQQLRTVDQQIRTNAIKSITNSYPGTSESEISSYIDGLLLRGEVSKLTELLGKKVLAFRQQNIRNIINMIKQTGINDKIAPMVSLTNCSTHCLIPAGFSRLDHGYRVYGGVNLGVKPVQTSGAGNGGCGHNVARYVEGLNSKGQWYCNAIALGGVTAQQHNLFSGYKSLNPNLNTQEYWAPRYNSSGTHHVTLHKDVGKPHNYYVHYCDGTQFKTKI